VDRLRLAMRHGNLHTLNPAEVQQRLVDEGCGRLDVMGRQVPLVHLHTGTG